MKYVITALYYLAFFIMGAREVIKKRSGLYLIAAIWIALMIAAWFNPSYR